MDREGFLFQALFITQEVLLRYLKLQCGSLIVHSKFSLMAALFFFFLFRGFYHLWPVFYFVLGFLVTVDVAGSYTEGQRGRSGCHRNLRFLERT